MGKRNLNLVTVLLLLPVIVLATLVFDSYLLRRVTAQQLSSMEANNATAPEITIQDKINSTYVVSKAEGEESEKAIVKAVKDRLIDLVHTVVARNATITSSGTITNAHTNESITVNNNNSRILEVLIGQLKISLERINMTSQAPDSAIQINTETEMICINRGTSHANCNIEIKIK